MQEEEPKQEAGGSNGEKLSSEEAYEDASILKDEFSQSGLPEMLDAAEKAGNEDMLEVLLEQERAFYGQRSEELAAAREKSKTEKAEAKKEISEREKEINGLAAQIMREAFQATRQDQNANIVIYSELMGDESLATTLRAETLNLLRKDYIKPVSGEDRDFQHDTVEGSSGLTNIPHTRLQISYWREVKGHEPGSLAEAKLLYIPPRSEK